MRLTLGKQHDTYAYAKGCGRELASKTKPVPF
jgi:hypothetical protein